MREYIEVHSYSDRYEVLIGVPSTSDTIVTQVEILEQALRALQREFIRQSKEPKNGTAY